MSWMRISLSLALLVVAAPLPAQGYIGGFVLDSATKAPIPCLQVALLDTAGRAVMRQLTIDDGAFQFDAPARGNYRLAFSLWDFEPLLTADEELEPTTEQTRTYSINLRPVDSAQRVVGMRFADSAPDAPPMPPVGARDLPEVPSRYYRKHVPSDLKATFDVLVDSTGRAVPSSVKILSSTDPEYGASVEKFLKRVKFEPGRLDHRPVCGWIRGETLVTHVYGRR